jgi:heme A synthase
MTDTPETVSIVPRWVRVWAVLTVAVALLLLFVLGGFVTSFRVGMADPVWPTEPWYLAGQDWSKLEFGFLVEHTHRAAGWVVGILVSGLALAVWATDPCRSRKFLGLAAILFLLVAYGEFHRGMMKAKEGYVPGTASEMTWPIGAGVATGVAALLCLAAAGAQFLSRSPGRWARAVAVVALIAVMIQGLLGGFRVFLNDELLGLVGTLLAAYHGAFAQVVFAVLVSVVVLSAPRKPGDSLAEPDRDRLKWLAIALPLSVFVQLIWGVWVRHMGSPVAQRLHVLTAFVVTGIAVWLAVRTLATPSGRRHLAFAAWHLIAIVAVQVLLGVEAWMLKFAATGPMGAIPPEARQVTIPSASIRTAHVVIGTALLASAVAYAIRVWRTPLEPAESPTEISPREAESVREPVGVS